MAKTTHIYFPTSEADKKVISSIWRLSEDDLRNRAEIILPKGTVEIIFNFSDAINYFNPSQKVSKLLPLVFVNGINFTPFQLTKYGRQEFLGIQLKSAGLKLLFNLSAKEFNDSVHAGNEVNCQLDILADELFFAPTFDQQVQIILRWVRQRLSASKCESSFHRIEKLHCLSSAQALSVRELSKAICLSDRQLRRFSIDWLGMNTEQFLLYNRYLTSLHLLHHSANLSLTHIGLEAGFYDQSHFIREFRHYTAMSPGQYRAANAEFPGHIPV